MPCGCKKGSGVSFRGGGMGIHGGGVRKRKRRKRKKKGSGLLGRDKRTWAPRGSGFMEAMFNPIGAIGSAAYKFARRGQTNRYAGLGSRVRAGFGRKRGSGMGFSGAGMAFNGAGLRTGRLFLRRGTGRRMI